jgi:hypothetical protein
LLWLSRAKSWLDSNGFTASFPYAHENLATVINQDSYWLNSELFEAGKKVIFDTLKINATSIDLANFSRRAQVSYERKNGYKPFEWSSILDEFEGVLFICGDIDWSSPDIADQIRNAALTIVHEPYPFKGVAVQDYDSVKPNYSLLNAIKDASLINSQLHKVGLHIRRGDYSRWENGRYYFDDFFWIEKINFHLARGVAVWIFSNDDLDEIKSQFVNSPSVFFSSGDFVEDFLKIQLMDEVFGPPSTFTSFACKLSQNFLNKNLKLTFFPPKD